MAYGMSKAGGLRVIRQEDGKDAKLFTDTKDRIFNVAISTSPSSVNQQPKEAIIGTGVSGTVYWVQLKNGERDHLEDALEHRQPPGRRSRSVNGGGRRFAKRSRHPA